MSNNHQQLENDFRRYLSGKMQHEEKEQFLAGLNIFSGEQLLELLEKDWIGASVPDGLPEQVYSSIMKKTAPERILTRSVHRVHFLRTAWFRVAVAILIIVGLGTYLWKQNINGTDDVANKPVPVQNDVLPGGNKATLTLADGSVIMLDSVASGQLAEQTGAVIRKSNSGEIVYAFNKTSLNNDVAYNTMSTPRGGTYQLVLPDGSRAWLNAESSITFSTAFTGKEREVKMTGEVFFDITSNKEKPFIVNTSNDRIEVLGTSFNVNAYPDEIPKTSLIEGAVKINNQLLAPGQAYVSGKVKQTNIDEDIAWRKGMFLFNNAGIKQVMQQLARWYDVEIRYEGLKSKGSIDGAMWRSWNLSEVMTALKKLGYNTRLEGTTLIVSE